MTVALKRNFISLVKLAIISRICMNMVDNLVTWFIYLCLISPMKQGSKILLFIKECCLFNNYAIKKKKTTVKSCSHMHGHKGEKTRELERTE